MLSQIWNQKNKEQAGHNASSKIAPVNPVRPSQMQSLMITPNKVGGAISRGSNVGNNPYGYPHDGAAPVDSCNRSSKTFSTATAVKPIPQNPKTDNP